jgi:hypothetical protein
MLVLDEPVRPLPTNIVREAQPAFLFHTYCQQVDELHVNVIEITINFTDTFVF